MRAQTDRTRPITEYSIFRGRKTINDTMFISTYIIQTTYDCIFCVTICIFLSIVVIVLVWRTVIVVYPRSVGHVVRISDLDTVSIHICLPMWDVYGTVRIFNCNPVIWPTFTTYLFRTTPFLISSLNKWIVLVYITATVLTFLHHKSVVFVS